MVNPNIYHKGVLGLRTIPRPGDQSGFTLVEFLGVTVIVIILSLLAVQVFDEAGDRARTARSSGELRSIETALERYRTDFGYYPDRLGKLIDEGYLKATTFQSPWPGKRNHRYYFYAVDDATAGKSMAYALADPGPTCSAEEKVLYADGNRPLPCGLDPDVRAYSFYVLPTVQLEGNSVELVRGHASLRSFRTTCQPSPGAPFALGCDLRTEG